ncbi:MAG: hypothetical protein AAGD01_15845 [Acidobacteriota bacterium]
MSIPSTQSLLASPNAAVVRRAAARGEWADFTEDGIAFDEQERVTEPGVVLPAELIRNLLVSQRPQGREGGPGVTAFGVRIRGARIVGRIDLRGARAWNEEACPPLVFEDCELVGNLEEAEWGDPRLRKRNCLDALDADLVYLGLQRCRLAVLDLRNARVRSDVRLDDVGPLVEGGPCWLRAGGSRVQGELRARRCTFRIHQKEDWQPSLPEESAVDLTRARITGSVALQPACLFDGGMRLGNARIGGDLWLAGGHLIARGSSALYAQMAQIDGVLGLRSHESTGGPHHRFRSEGGINLYGATIGSTLELSGALLTPAEGEDKASTSSLSANLTRIGGDVLMRPWKPKTAEVLKGNGEDGWALTDEEAAWTVGGTEATTELPAFDSAVIPEVPFEAKGTIYFNNATIVGFFTLDGSVPYLAAPNSELKSYLHITMQGGTLALQSSSIEGELRVGGEIDEFRGDSMEARSDVRLSGDFRLPIVLSAATVHGDLRIGGEVAGVRASSLIAHSTLRCTGDLTEKIFLDSAAVSGEVKILSQKPVDRISATNARFSSHFEVNCELDWLLLTGSRLAGRLSLSGRCGSLMATSVEVDGEVSLHGALRRAVDFRNATFGSSLSWVPRRFLWPHLFAKHGLDVSEATSSSELEPELRPISLGSSGWQIQGVKGVIFHDGHWLEGWDDVRFVHRRRRALACYPGWQLWECTAWLPRRVDTLEPSSSALREWPPGDLGAVAFLYDPVDKLLVLLDGRSAPIHRLNNYGALKLETAKQAEDYLRFFCSYIWGEEGAFQILETMEQMPQGAEVRFIDAETGKVTRDPGSWVRPLVVDHRGPDGAYFSRATVLYGGALFEATFRVHSTGMVDMLDDEPCGWLEGDSPLVYQQPARVVKRRGASGTKVWRQPEGAIGEVPWLPPPQLVGEWIDESEGLKAFRSQRPTSVRWVLENARCGGDIFLAGTIEPLRARGLQVEGQLTLGGTVGELLDLEASKVGGNLIFDAADSPAFGLMPLRLRAGEASYTKDMELNQGSPEPERWMLNLESATIGGALQVRGLEALFAERSKEQLSWKDGHRVALRWRSLDCLPRWRHWEALVVLEETTLLHGLWPLSSHEEGAEVAVVGFLRKEGSHELVALDDEGEALTELLHSGDVELETEEQLLSFLKLWYGTTGQPEGTPGAKILEQPADLAGLPALSAVESEAVAPEVMTPEDAAPEDAAPEDGVKGGQGKPSVEGGDTVEDWLPPRPRWEVPAENGSRKLELHWLFGREVYRRSIEVDPEKPPPSLYRLEMGAPVATLGSSPPSPRYRSGAREFPAVSPSEDARLDEMSGAPPATTFRLPLPWIVGDWRQEREDGRAAELYGELLRARGKSRPIDFWSLVYGEVAEPKVGINLHRCSSGALVDDDGRTWGPRLRLKLDGFDYGWTDASQRVVTASKDSREESFSLDPQTAREIQRQRLRDQLPSWQRRISDAWSKWKERWAERIERWRTPASARLAPRQWPWEQRLDWLARQFDHQLAAAYSPQPFEYLASVLRKQGAEEAARNTLLHKLQFERRGRSRLRYLASWFYDLSFGHGLQPLRAWTTFALFIVLGTLCADYGTQGMTWRVCQTGTTILESERQLRSEWAHRSGFTAVEQKAEQRPPTAEEEPRPWQDELPIMVYRVEAVTEIATSELDRWSTEEILSAEGKVRPLDVPAGFAREVPCIDRVQPLLYALDVFVPLVDLDQEPLCMVSARPDAWPWRLLKGLYRAAGWVVTSLLLLTVTGVLRKHVER